MFAERTITHDVPLSNPTPDAVDAFLSRIEQAAALAYPACIRCGCQIFRGDLTDTTGFQHISCPEVEPYTEWERRTR